MSVVPQTERQLRFGRWARAWAYAAAWLAPLGVMVWFVPPYAAVFNKLEEKGDLPELAQWSFAFVRFNEAYYYLPAAAALAAAVVAAEALRGSLRRARRERLGALAWGLGVVCVGLLVWLVALSAPLLLMKMGSMVALR
jgi:hypothetical protein